MKFALDERQQMLVAERRVEGLASFHEQHGCARRVKGVAGTDGEGFGELLGGGRGAEGARRVLQHSHAGFRGFRRPPRREQLPFVVLTFRRVEDRHPDAGGSVVGSHHDDRVDQQGQFGPVRAPHGQCDLSNLAGEAENHHIARLVEELARGREEVGERDADQRLTRVAGPTLEGAVDLRDDPGGRRDEISARRTLEEPRVHLRRPGFLAAHR
jgi:hypothetical protein